jgi:hypothetical protein
MDVGNDTSILWKFFNPAVTMRFAVDGRLEPLWWVRVVAVRTAKKYCYGCPIGFHSGRPQPENVTAELEFRKKAASEGRWFDRPVS